jgi:hypothetical protein
MAYIIYTRNDYDRIKKEGFEYSLPQETLDAIKKISANVGAPEYIKTPHFDKKPYKPRIHLKEVSDAEWDSIRNFKTTVIEKKKGIDLSIDKIRKHLNKMTAKTYNTLQAEICTEIDLIVATKAELDDTDADSNDDLLPELKKIGDAIFEIASGNRFYSAMYATLYNLLMCKYEFMKTILTAKLNTDTPIFNDFAYCSPDKDYDQFCNNNKINEKRRALSLFYVNLMLQKIIPKETIIQMIIELQTNLATYINTESNANIVEEMSELLFGLIITGAPELKTLKSEWNTVLERVTLVSKMKAKSAPSISNKTIFKHMDILMELNKV